MEPTAYRYREVHILLHPTGPYRKAVDPLSTRKCYQNILTRIFRFPFFRSRFLLLPQIF